MMEYQRYYWEADVHELFCDPFFVRVSVRPLEKGVICTPVPVAPMLSSLAMSLSVHYGIIQADGSGISDSLVFWPVLVTES